MKTYIFDLYGTLIDVHTELYNHKIWKALSDMYACYGAIYTPEQFKQAYLKFNEEEWKRVETLHPDTYIDIQFKNVFKRLYDEASLHTEVLSIQDKETWLLFIETEFRRLTRIRCKPYPNTIKTLQALKKQGHQIILLSNAQRSFALVEMGICGLLPYFDHMYISADYGIRKPEKAFMQKVLDDHHLNVRDCLMIGNEVGSDMQVAAACGVSGILLNTAHRKEKEIQKELEILQQEYPDFQYRIVTSGDILEILGE